MLMSAHILWLALQYITLSTMNYRKYKQLICLNWYVYIFYDGFEWAYPVRIRTVRFSCQDLNKRRKHSNDVTFIAFLFIYLFIYMGQLNVGNSPWFLKYIQFLLNFELRSVVCDEVMGSAVLWGEVLAQGWLMVYSCRSHIWHITKEISTAGSPTACVM